MLKHDKNMYKEQRELTEHILFNYYLISSTREDEICSQFPFYLDKEVFDEMVYSADILNKLSVRIIKDMISDKNSSVNSLEDFLLKNDILNIKTPLQPFFWVRYDAFQREEGGIFFSEFNYDKPCAQREIILSNELCNINSPNSKFVDKFKESFLKMWKAFGKDKSTPRVAILVDPGHYEELHLAYLYIDLLKPLGFEFIIAGGDNLEVRENRLFAFGLEVDIILRQYPTEFLYEINNISDILELVNTKTVLMINDPRAIIGQTKGLFARLWKLVEDKSDYLSPEEILVIKKTIPYTKIFDKSLSDEVLKNKDNYVIKAVYGRYSEEVYIGKMLTMDEWIETVKYVSECEFPHILQEFCPIKKENVLRYNGEYYQEEDAYANYGIYIIEEEVCGTCIRWSKDYLTRDDTIWMSPIGIRESSLKIDNLIASSDYAYEDIRKAAWQEINDRATFKWGLTDNYTGNIESFLLQGLILSEQDYREIRLATEMMVDIFKKTAWLVMDNSSIFCPVLGIDDALLSLMSKYFTENICCIGRFDWVFDSIGNLKLLEFNSETPAGIFESILLNEEIIDRLDIKYINPNSKLKALIQDTFKEIINDYCSRFKKEVKNIGILASPNHEDWYTIQGIFECVKSLPFNFVLGDIANTKYEDGKLYLYDMELHAVYRHYPIDWIASDTSLKDLMKAIENGILSINMPYTLIYHSKAFFALIWELLDNSFYSRKEEECIKKYIPYTCLSLKKMDEADFCVKPFLGREGQGIIYSIESNNLKVSKNENIFQKRVDIQSVQVDLYSTIKKRRTVQFPVIGGYVIGNNFGGIYTRVGNKITNKCSYYLPTFVKEIE